jgi:glutamate racemase
MEKQTVVSAKLTDSSVAPICVFDSGIGGLNLLSECAKRLPERDFVYVADNYNVPYGNKSHAQILELARGAFDVIATFNPSAAVVACNTVTAECIQTLREEYDFPIVGIQPAIKQAAKAGGVCLVLATCATIKSHSFCELAKKYLPSDAIIYPCVGLAEYIEQNIFDLPSTLPDGLLPDVHADSVVLGCTHYGFIKKIIREKYRCEIFDGILGTADHLVKILGNDDHKLTKIGKINFVLGNYDKNRQIYCEVIGKG